MLLGLGFHTWKAKRAIFITKIDFGIHYKDGENGLREKEEKRKKWYEVYRDERLGRCKSPLGHQ